MLIHSYQALWKNTNMALRTGYETEEWKSYFIKEDISANSAKSYAATFVREKLMKENFQMIDWAMLKELGIMAMGEALSILKQAKEPSTQTIYAKASSAKLSQPLWNDPPTIQKISNWLGSVHQNDRHANFSNQHPII